MCTSAYTNDASGMMLEKIRFLFTLLLANFFLHVLLLAPNSEDDPNHTACIDQYFSPLRPASHHKDSSLMEVANAEVASS